MAASFDRALGRRAMLAGVAGLSCAVARLPGARAAADAPETRQPDPAPHARVWGATHSPAPDAEVIVLDHAFRALLAGNAVVERVWGHGQWLEGPAWSAQGRYLLFSDTATSHQYRYVWETGEVTLFRPESYHASGSTFDYQGRQITCEHVLRRVIRWEHDGSVHVVADRFEGQRLNGPNDVIAHPDGSIWFTDPVAGPLRAGEPGSGQPVPTQGGAEAQIASPQDHTFRVDVSGRIDVVLNQQQLVDPNGLCFSPDFSRLYVASAARQALRTRGQGKGDAKKHIWQDGDLSVHVFDLHAEELPLSNPRLFTNMRFEGEQMMPDGIRADLYGNIWCGVSGSPGKAGVFVFNPEGQLIGRIRLPQGVSNLTFAGPERDWLFMCAGSTLYRLRVGTQGCAPG
ncbi:MAG: SMP-30/gluconolactonase/LRE family protein [Acetobacter papayae]|uniref:SMP-30/gluconolactonase/LRE family protein n=1 Tax=Acetobacter papayae TaxID=1076592 RepID=UPI0039EA626F